MIWTFQEKCRHFIQKYSNSVTINSEDQHHIITNIVEISLKNLKNPKLFIKCIVIIDIYIFIMFFSMFFSWFIVFICLNETPMNVLTTHLFAPVSYGAKCFTSELPKLMGEDFIFDNAQRMLNTLFFESFAVKLF